MLLIYLHHSIDPNKTRLIQEMPIPTTKDETTLFLQMAQFNLEFLHPSQLQNIPYTNYAEVTAPLRATKQQPASTGDKNASNRSTPSNSSWPQTRSWSTTTQVNQLGCTWTSPRVAFQPRWHSSMQPSGGQSFMSPDLLHQRSPTMPKLRGKVWQYSMASHASEDTCSAQYLR